VSVGQLDAEHRVRQSLDNRSLDLDDAVLLGHYPLSYSFQSHGHAGMMRADMPEHGARTKVRAYAILRVLAS
jgi:hypothetical protein